MPRSRPLRAALAGALALAALPASAQAVTVGLDGPTLVYASQGEAISTLVSTTERYDGDTGTTTKYLVFGESASGATFAIDPATGCIPAKDFYGTGVACPFDPAARIRIVGSPGRDSMSVFSANDVPDSIDVELHGLGGNDQLGDAYNGTRAARLFGGPGNDKLEGYDGADLLDAGDGDDEVDGGAGPDRVLGGAGNDSLLGDRYKEPAADVIDGGPGNDLVGEWSDPSADFSPKPSLSLDGVANDGRPGEGDNVTNVERVEQFVATDFAGSDAPEAFEIKNGGTESATVTGAGGDDKLLAWDGNDRVDGGAGDDVLEGGLGHDTVVGGPGRDTIFGDGTRSFCGGWSCKVPFGNDTIEAVDGAADDVDCGAGDDLARVDAIDVVAANCERVERSGAPAGGGPGGPAPAGGSGATKLTWVGGLTAKALGAGRLKLRVPCAAACRVTATLKARGRTIAAGKATLLRGGTATVALRRARGAKVRKGRATLVLKVTGASGKPATTTRSITLR